MFTSFSTFAEKVLLSQQEVCLEVFRERRGSGMVKKDKTVARNLPRIFAAALAISRDKGFQAMTMRDLGRETGLSLGALYAYFSGKEELLAMLQQTGRTVSQRILQDSVEQAVGPQEKLLAAIRTHLYLSEAMQDWFYFSYMEARNLSPEEREKAVASELYTEDLLAEIISDGLSRGVFRHGDGRPVASAVKALLQDWYVKRWKYAKRGVSVDQYADFIWDFVRAFCRNGESAQENLSKEGGS